VDNASLNQMLSTPLVLPAPIAGALAALFLVIVIVAIRRAARGTGSRLVLPICAIAIGTVAVYGLLDRLANNERAAGERALLDRSAHLNAAAVAPGSPLACLDGTAGEQVENACEKAVFADPQSTASAVAYISARLTLLADAAGFAQRSGPDVLAAFAASRRALELDRYGIAAHVLTVRDGCTVEKCAAFAMLQDVTTLKANMKAQAFDTYVSRYAVAWGKTEPAAERQPQAAVSTLPPSIGSTEVLPPSHPVDSKYDFPSSASIPPVSIMNAEPPPAPKDHTGTATAAPANEKAAANPPVPPKRPQTQAASPPAR